MLEAIAKALDPATEEHIADLKGEETIPAQGARVERKGKHWKVVAVNKEETVTTPKRFQFIACTQAIDQA